jgi:phosphoribosylaminoimidazolecarboxamide formyltransferase/IMP cyclohydrolase
MSAGPVQKGPAQDNVAIRRALISVSDKAGLSELAKALLRHGVEILSTGGTAAALKASGAEVIEVGAYTGFPEMLDGRVKTLHPRIHGGLLGRRDLPAHEAQMKEHGIEPIDLVVVNLYPFEATVARGAGFAETIENIDIGGPSMIRSAAKNHESVVVLTDPADYAALIAALDAGGGTTPLTLRRQLAAAAYARTAAYDAAIAAWFAGELHETYPRRLTIAATLAQSLRYGENPHQNAALYASTPARPGVASARQVQGKELSYNNINDTDAAFEAVAEFAEPAIAIIKHANPCGVAIAATLDQAWAKAFACDTVSAFGGIVAANRKLDGATAKAIAQIFVEVVIAPGADDDALAVFAQKKNLRLLLTEGLPDAAAPGLTFKSLAGGLLAQSRDNGRVTRAELKTMTKRAPSEAEFADLLFGWTVAKHVKSNAIVFVKGGATVGIGAGQMSRVDSARIAVMKAAEQARVAGEPSPRTQDAVVASDAFFPFPDGLIACAEAGATAFIQPGGSMRDAEVIAAADARGCAMVATGMRHFRH